MPCSNSDITKVSDGDTCCLGYQSNSHGSKQEDPDTKQKIACVKPETPGISHAEGNKDVDKCCSGYQSSYDGDDKEDQDATQKKAGSKPDSIKVPNGDGNEDTDTCCSGSQSTCHNEDRQDINTKRGSQDHPGRRSQEQQIVVASNQVQRHTNDLVDIEKAATQENITVRIAGMTCTGCAKKVTGVLEKISGVSDVQINFVASIGQFRLVNDIVTAKEIIKQIEDGTGFKCSQAQADLQCIDLKMSADKAHLFMASLPSGVEFVEKIGRIYQVDFNPTVIGARSVFELSGADDLGPPRDDFTTSAGKRKLVSTCISFIIASLFTIPVVVIQWSNSSLSYQTRSIIAITFATIVQAVAIPEFYIGAIKSLIYSRVIEMDMLVVISITAAYVYSVVAFGLTHANIELEQGEFFETSCLLITLVLLGRVLSAYAKNRAITAVSLKSLQVEKAILMINTIDSREIDARLLEYSDTIQILPHSRIVTDGIIISGASSVDESMITGESIPIPITVGDKVVAGTINQEAPLLIRIYRLPGRNSITDVATLVENALSAKSHVQDIADKIAGYFVPVVVFIAILVFIVWIIVGLKIRGLSAGGAFGLAITYTISVLAISCPCAIGLAVPLVQVLAGGLGARSGILIKRADATERSYKITDVVFDKTGTLTYSDLQVQGSKVSAKDFNEVTISGIVLGLVKDNQHPVSVAVALAVKAKDIRPMTIESLQSIPGKGIKGTWNNHEIRGGNPYWLGSSCQSQLDSNTNKSDTLFCVMLDSQLVAVYSLKATIRVEAVAVIHELGVRNIQCHIVSGDSPSVVLDTAKALNIPPVNALSRHSPAEKQAYVKKLMDEGKYVLFCGDGTNDAVAVAQAHVGVQIGDTSDVVKATADVVLLGGLDGILVLLDISKRSLRRINFNFVWSAVYNVFAILLAGGTFVKIRIPPAYAGLGEIVSILPVILAAMSLIWL